MMGSGGTLITGQLVLHKIDDSITQGNLLPDAGNQARREVTGPLNILLAGLDYRKDDPDSEMGQRADSIMWVHIPREHDRAYILSLPRDLVVPIPEFPAAKFDGSRGDRINAAFDYGMQNKQGRPGGMQLLVKTVSELTGVNFDMAGVIDWYGFTGIVGQLGGVQMCLEQPIQSHHSKLVFPKGCMHYNEHAALELVRQRYDVQGGDYGRQKLQQQFIKQILKQATTADVISNPMKLNGIVKAVGSSLMLDLGGYEFADLIWSLKGISPNDIMTMQIPHSGLGGPDYAGEQLDQPRGNELFKAIADERIDAFLIQNSDLASKLPA